MYIYDQEESQLRNTFVSNLYFLVASVTLWVGRLPKGSYDMLMQAFGEFGEIKNIDVSTFKYLLEKMLSPICHHFGWSFPDKKAYKLLHIYIYSIYI